MLLLKDLEPFEGLSFADCLYISWIQTLCVQFMRVRSIRFSCRREYGVVEILWQIFSTSFVAGYSFLWCFQTQEFQVLFLMMQDFGCWPPFLSVYHCLNMGLA